MEVPVQGDVLKWAREFRDLSLDDAAERLGLPAATLEALEAGIRKPSLTLFEKIGAAYRIPLCTLFRKTRPKEPKRPTDFRTVGGGKPKSSFDYTVAESHIRNFQRTLGLLRSEDEEFPFVELRHYAYKGDPFAQGAFERETIGVAVKEQLDWKSDEGFARWRAIIEHAGVAVYLQKFDLQAGRAFSLWDNGDPPAIIINKSDRSPNALTYSLIHEYAHLLIRQPGVSDLNPQNPVEVFCNRFAAAFLMPEEGLKLLLPMWPNSPVTWDPGTIWNAAKRLKVSGQAVAIRLEELHKAPSGFNNLFAIKPPPPPEPKAGQKIDFVRVKLSELGGRYTDSVMGALDREVIDVVQASQALGLSFNPKSLVKVRKYVQKYRQLVSAA
jgi:Zn-dependent peptidase ImmA (M78 family)/DNA-binding XRE family transcriptional regulator